MKTKLLFLDMEFTSLSPDAQLISLGCISDCDRSIYCEFTDFDLNRCDDWVRENVVSKLLVKENSTVGSDYPNTKVVIGATQSIKNYLSEWLQQFSDYDIQIVVDCGTWDWYHFLQLVAEWDVIREDVSNEIANPSARVCSEFKAHDLDVKLLLKAKGREIQVMNFELPNQQVFIVNKSGLPKLPSNISPVPLDLNDLIAHKRGISVREAFDLNREEILTADVKGMTVNENSALNGEPMQKHNSLWDAKVIKAIYQKLQ